MHEFKVVFWHTPPAGYHIWSSVAGLQASLAGQSEVKDDMV